VAPTTAIADDAYPEPFVIPRLDNGLPATFVGVTEGWEAVEVDTATGNIVRSLGRLERPGQSDDEAGLSLAIQQVWRSSDHRSFVVNQCCEPAAGELYAVDGVTRLTADNRSDHFFAFGWTAAPSPFDDRVAISGLVMAVGPVEGPLQDLSPVDQSRQPSGVIGWDRDARGVTWVSNRWTPEGGVDLFRARLSDEDEAVVLELSWVEPNQWIDGIGSQESGNYVGFLNTQSSDPENPSVMSTEGVVFAATGELIATFPVETGSYWGGYDPSGKVLIYTDADNVVRWQGLGQSGVLAEGFIHASW
jgi:hypothetical protein